MKETSGLAIVESMKRIDSNLMQQRQRNCNIVISGLDETEQEDPKQIAYWIIIASGEKTREILMDVGLIGSCLSHSRVKKLCLSFTILAEVVE